MTLQQKYYKELKLIKSKIGDAMRLWSIYNGQEESVLIGILYPEDIEEELTNYIVSCNSKKINIENVAYDLDVMGIIAAKAESLSKEYRETAKAFNEYMKRENIIIIEDIVTLYTFYDPDGVVIAGLFDKDEVEEIIETSYEIMRHDD